jgi:hypothetical protein
MSANEFKETQEVLNKFAKYVIQQSRTNLTKGKKNVDKTLYNSLSFEQKQNQDIFSLDMFMMDYGKFQDKGVNGKNKSYGSIYSFRNKKPPMQPLADWAKARNIRLRDEKGRYKKGNYRTIGFILQKSIYEKGIKPSLFFTKPFEKAWGLLPQQLIEAYGKDMDGEFEQLLR